jgi:hypothetical protein
MRYLRQVWWVAAAWVPLGLLIAHTMGRRWCL